MKIIAIIVAGGSSLRFGKESPKQYELLGKITILEKTISQFLKSSYNIEILVVIRTEDENLYQEIPITENILPFCHGGKTRTDSVYNGLIEAQKYNPDYVLIHDACRPYVSPKLIDNLIDKLIAGEDAVCPVIPVSETVKRINENQVEIIDREKLFLIQTPQCFKFKEIFECVAEAQEKYTDETSLYEAYGKQVKYILGERENIKITVIEDLVQTQEVRIGNGFDAHKFSDEEALDNFVVLGGVKIPSKKKILAHSDGDVLIHALVDAILGAIGAGDIGEHFPPSDNKWKNANSMLFLKFALEKLKEKSGTINNIDVTVICEKPKLSNFKEQIKENIAKETGISLDRINIKATTTEKMGFTGREEGIAVMAAVAVSLIA